MKYIQATLVCCCLVLISADVLAVGCGKMPVMSATDPDGGRVELILDSDLIEKTSQWIPERGEPPLSVGKAANIAQKWNEKNYKGADSIEMRDISLRSLGCSSMSNRWYYLIEFLPKVNGAPRFEPGNWVAVLLNGEVIGPTKSIASK